MWLTSLKNIRERIYFLIKLEFQACSFTNMDAFTAAYFIEFILYRLLFRVVYKYAEIMLFPLYFRLEVSAMKLCY